MNFSADATNMMLFGAIELALLFLLSTFFLGFQNRSLKKLISKLRARLQNLIAEKVKNSSAKNAEAQQGQHDKNYHDYLSQQIKATHARHLALEPTQDISLDISGATPLPRRVAALRFALLQAEHEATKDDAPNWEALQKIYAQIFSYFEDDTGEAQGGIHTEENERLTLELTNAKQRVTKLEKFEGLYTDLKKHWLASRDKAEKSYGELSLMTAQFDDSLAYKNTLDTYHAAYNELEAVFEPGEQTKEGQQELEEAQGEINHLRSVATEQHGIITALQQRLKSSESDQEKAEIMDELQGQLSTQIRYVQESETCIKLLEDELSNANKEVAQLKKRASTALNLKAALNDVQAKYNDLEEKYHALKIK